ncbi:MAG: hypothetical protein ABIG32_00510 [Candidatus Uhrbacteria bacterium]
MNRHQSNARKMINQLRGLNAQELPNKLIALLAKRLEISNHEAGDLAYHMVREIDAKADKNTPIDQVYEQVFISVFKACHGVNVSYALAHLQCLHLLGPNWGNLQQRLQLARRLALDCPIDRAEDIPRLTSVYADFARQVAFRGPEAWELLISNPVAFCETVKTALKWTEVERPGNIFFTAREFLRLNIKIELLDTMLERCGQDRFRDIFDLLHADIANAAVIDSFRRCPEIVTNRSKVDLHFLVTDWNRDGRPMALWKYAEHHRVNLGYVPPEPPAAVKPSAQPQADVREVGGPAQPPAQKQGLSGEPKLTKRRQQPRTEEPSEDKPRPTGELPAAPDLTRLHEELDLGNLAPDTMNAELASAILVHGFLRPSSSRTFAGKRGIGKTFLRRRVATRCSNFIPNEFNTALSWLIREGVVNSGVKGFSLAIMTDASSTGAEILRRLQKLNSRFN